MGGIIRDLNSLSPYMKQKATLFLVECHNAGIPVMILETKRTDDVQTAYYAQGRLPLAKTNYLRTLAGLYLITEEENKKIITNSKAGESYHGYGEAFDAVPVEIVSIQGARKILWDRVDLFEEMANIGRKLDLKCGADFKSKDLPHYQNPNFKIPVKV